MGESVRDNQDSPEDRYGRGQGWQEEPDGNLGFSARLAPMRSSAVPVDSSLEPAEPNDSESDPAQSHCHPDGLTSTRISGPSSSPDKTEEGASPDEHTGHVAVTDDGE